MKRKPLLTKPTKLALTIAGLYLAGTTAANAAVIKSIGADNDAPSACTWKQTTCWSGGSVPGGNDKVGIIGGDTVTYDQDSETFIQHLRIGANVGSNRNLYPAAGESGYLVVETNGLTLHSSDLKIGQAGDIPNTTTFDSASGNILDAENKIVANSKGFIEFNEGDPVSSSVTNSKVTQTDGLVWITTKSNSTIGSVTISAVGYAYDSDEDTINDAIKPSASASYNISNGTFRVSGNSTTVRTGGILDISGTAMVDLLQLKAAGLVNVSGSQATISLASWVAPAVEDTIQPEGHVNFTLDASGPSTINIAARQLADVVAANNAYNLSDNSEALYSGSASLCEHNINVDGASYTGGSQSFDLITADSFVCSDSEGNPTDSVSPKSIALNFDDSNYVASTTQTDTALSLNIIQNEIQTVALANPLADASINVDEVITLSATVTDSDGISDVSKVEFFNGDSLIGEGVLQADNTSFTLDWTPDTANPATTIKVVTTDIHNRVVSQEVAVAIISSAPDADGDGVPDESDLFPNDATEWADSDSDSVGDNSDDFPDDASASLDSDGDGYPDALVDGVETTLVLDQFKDDAAAHLDTDGDGYPDSLVDGIATSLILDAFPTDNAEQLDNDGDGVGNNSDFAPDDPAVQIDPDLDSDNDGVKDVEDAFPNDPTETMDSDGDGVGDNADQFPQDPNETVDSDGDGVGDNADDYPDDPSRFKDLKGANPQTYSATTVIAAENLIEGTKTSLNIEADVTIDCQVGIANAPCFKVDETSTTGLAIDNQGVIEVSDDNDPRGNARVLYLSKASIYNIVNRGPNSVMKANDDAIRITNSTVTNGIFNQGLMTSGTTNNNDFRRATIAFTGTSSAVTGGITNTGTLEYREENDNTVFGHAINLGGKAGRVHDIDFINNSGTIYGNITIDEDGTVELFENSGTVNGHVGSLDTEGYIVDHLGNATDYQLRTEEVEGVVQPVLDENGNKVYDIVDIENYEVTFSPNSTLNAAINSGQITGMLALGGEAPTYTSLGGQVGALKQANTINIKIHPEKEDSTSIINSPLTFDGTITFEVDYQSESEQKHAQLQVNGDLDLTGAVLEITTNATMPFGTQFTLLTAGEAGSVSTASSASSNSSLVEPFSTGEVINAGNNNYFEISVSDDGKSLIATTIDTIDTDGDGVLDRLDYYPNDPEKWEDDVTDTDSDGTADLYDAFPEDPTETEDSDGDGYGNNVDYYDDDATKWQDDVTDTDGDGTADLYDEMPNDPNETLDSDNDGVGDNADEFPFDSTRTEEVEEHGGSTGIWLGLLGFIRLFKRK